MCDTLCVTGDGRTLFAKNSDRPMREVQTVETFARRPAQAALATQYLSIPDTGAAAVVGSRPDWLFGFEHGVNEHRVAIGNEKIWTIDDPHAAPAALIGMDLVRLGLERARSADDALAVVTTLLEAHGQGGVADADAAEPYWSSFLIADPAGGWIVETSGRTWVARPTGAGDSISNRVTTTTDWTRASSDVAAGSDFDTWRAPDAPTGVADQRLAATRACVARTSTGLGPRDLVAVLRDHGHGPWGEPGDTAVSPVPTEVDANWNGISVCMHISGYQCTTSSMIAELPDDPAAPLRVWAALGSPCVSVYVPGFGVDAVAPELADAAEWHRFELLRDRAEAGAEALGAIRAQLAPVEAELWAEADGLVAAGAASQQAFAAGAWARVDAALRACGV